MDGFDEDEWAEMQEMYVNHTCKELLSIMEDIESKSFDSLRTFGHNIKGSGGMYGFNEVTEIGADGTSCRCQIKDGLNREAVHLAKFLDQNIIY